jgi:hypothetical protein
VEQEEGLEIGRNDVEWCIGIWSAVIEEVHRD